MAIIRAALLVCTAILADASIAQSVTPISHSINLAYVEKPANQEQAIMISDRVLDKAEREINKALKFRNLAAKARFYAIIPGRNELIRGMIFDSAAGERMKRTFNGGVDYPALWPVGRHVVAYGAMPGFVYTVASAKPTMLVVTYSIKEDRLSDSFYY